MSRGVFITGTDTGVGKTLVSASLLSALNARDIPAVGMKPVASGSERTAQGLRNADAERLLERGAVRLDYAEVNTYAFAAPIAPHIAAADAGVAIDGGVIEAAFETLTARARCVVVEGVGGWMAPLGPQLMQRDLVQRLRLPVILVVGLRLGCINHALLSARAITADGCALLGWIGSHIDPDMLRADANVATLRERVAAPCLGILPFAPQADPDALAAHLGAVCERLLANDAVA